MSKELGKVVRNTKKPDEKSLRELRLHLEVLSEIESSQRLFRHKDMAAHTQAVYNGAYVE